MGRALPAVFLLFSIYGCVGAFSRAQPPDYFQLDYSPRPATCSKPFSGAVRIWALTASAPYDREQMVVVTPSDMVRFSSNHRWVAPPGNMLADKIMRDMSLSRIFEDAVPVGSPVSATFEMAGHIYRFALEENGSPPHAVLDLDVTFWQEIPVRTILLKKNFHYESPPLSGHDPSEFSKAMAEIVSRLSADLRNEICTVMQGS